MHHENTELYKKMLELVADCTQVIKRFPRGEAKLADQIKRASRAVPALFAEGARRRSPADRSYYFDMSASSARETSSHVDVAHVSELISADERLKLKDKCDRICAMLYKFR